MTGSRIYGDVDMSQMGTEPPSGVTKPTDDTKAPAEGASAIQDFKGKGALLEEQDEKKVFKAIDSIVERQETLAKNREAARKHWGRVRRGVPFSVLNKSEDSAVWTAELPPGVTDTPSPIPNKGDDLCRKIVAQIVVDIPQPDPKPANDDEKDRGAADLAKRFLKQDGDESGTNDAELFIDILDSAMTDASDFAHVWADMQGGGWRPLRVMAHPQAEDAGNPLVAYGPAPIDPMTGQPQVDEQGQPAQGPEIPTSDYILRYVNDANQFVESPVEAAKQWMPKLCRDVLGPQHVRTLPETADISRASGVILCMVAPMSDLKRRYPEIAEWPDEKLDRLASWKPRRARTLIPPALRGRFKDQQKAEKTEAGTGDDTLVFWYVKYCSVGQDYNEGAEIAVSGMDGGAVIRKALLRKDIEGQDKEPTVLLRDIPVSQCKALHDSENRDPMGRRPLELFGGTNEALMNLYGAVQQDTDRRLHPNVFLPSTSPVQAWQMNQRDGRPIPVYSKDDLPMYEEFADMASFVPQVIDQLESAMREAAMLGSAAEMLNTPDAVSGKAKAIELNQAKVALAPVAMNFLAFVKRYWRIKLQMAQAFLTLPQQVEFAGVDQAYKQRWWTGADFAGVKDVAIQAGTGTMMSPGEKQQFLSFAQQAQWIDIDEAMEVGRGTMADDLGLTPSPHEDSIKRELAVWIDGPQEGWIEGAQAYNAEVEQLQAMQAETAMDGGEGADTQTQPMGQPQAPSPTSPFLPRPTDEDPLVAKKQYQILRDFIATSDYSKHPPEWKALIDQRFQIARQGAGVVYASEQMAQQQAQMEQQAAQGEAERGSKAEESAANRDHQSQENAADREAQTQQAAMRQPVA